MPDFETFLRDQGLDGLLFVGDSLCNSDMYYLSRFFAGDRFTLLISNGVSLLVSSMETGRAKKESSADKILSTMHFGMKEKLKITGKSEEAFLLVLKEFLISNKIERFGITSNFPCGIYNYLLNDFEVSVIDSPVSLWRAKKNQKEIEAIRFVQDASQYAMRTAIRLISKAKPIGDVLFWEGELLTSERVRGLIEMVLLKRNCDAVDTIVAGGIHSADPHVRGNGPLPANAPIIIDIFPRSKSTRYFADMTRTVVRGEANAEVKELFSAVLEAQMVGIRAIKEGILGRDVHYQVSKVFDDHGFSEREGKGFMHSTGHGVGIDVHERPSLSEAGELLEANNVVTIEPGLYYPEIGGVRLEDLLVVTAKGCDNLTHFEKQLVI
ncbi:MAG: Xaa-Pro peptidase family protein [Methanotrichaceae archaeon]|nr:Xaa-Pro peptidase family protein [Methanotrichaceae archaeon]